MPGCARSEPVCVLHCRWASLRVWHFATGFQHINCFSSTWLSTLHCLQDQCQLKIRWVAYARSDSTFHLYEYWWVVGNCHRMLIWYAHLLLSAIIPHSLPLTGLVFFPAHFQGTFPHSVCRLLTAIWDSAGPPCQDSSFLFFIFEVSAMFSTGISDERRWRAPISSHQSTPFNFQ